MSEADAAYQQGYDRGIASTAAALTAATQRAEQAEADLRYARESWALVDCRLSAAEALNAELAAALREQAANIDRIAAAFQMLGNEEVRERLALAHFDTARCLEAIRNRAAAALNRTPAAAAERVAAMEARATAGSCECSDDDVCRLVRERDEARAQAAEAMATIEQLRHALVAAGRMALED